MARATFSTTFYCRSSKTNKQGLAPLELSIIVNQERLFLNLPSKLNPTDFNRKRKPNHIEDLLNTYRVRINEVCANLMSEGLPITSATLRDYLKTGGTKSLTIKKLLEEFIKHITPTHKATAVRKYELVGDYLISTLTADKEICTLTLGDGVKLYEGLKQKFLPSTSAGYMTKIRTIFGYAVDNGMMKINPTNSIKLDKGKREIEYLTTEEINALKSLNLGDYERLEKVRDLLLFQSSTGLAYADLITFDINKLQYDNNIPVYRGRRVKTGVEYTAIILPMGMDILKKYDNTLPLISNQKYNAYLKEIQKLANIKTNLTTHLARKSYAHYLLNNGVRLEIVSKTLGHSSTLITQKIYCETSTSTIANEVGKIFNNPS